jgi:hypothetical protein
MVNAAASDGPSYCMIFSVRIVKFDFDQLFTPEGDLNIRLTQQKRSAEARYGSNSS